MISRACARPRASNPTAFRAFVPERFEGGGKVPDQPRAVKLDRAGTATSPPSVDVDEWSRLVIAMAHARSRPTKVRNLSGGRPRTYRWQRAPQRWLLLTPSS